MRSEDEQEARKLFRFIDYQDRKVVSKETI